MRLRSGHSVVLSILILLTANAALGSGRAAHLTADTDRLLISDFIQALDDPGGSLTISDVSSPGMSARFRQCRGDSLNFGITPSAHWLRLRFVDDARGNAANEWIFHIGRPCISSARFYISDGSRWIRKQAGASQYITDGDRSDRAPVFAFRSRPRREQTIYLRVSSVASSFMKPEICTYEQFLRESRNRMLGLGMYYGVVLALGLYNLLLFVSLRDKSYLWYVLHQAFVAQLFLTINGLTFEHLPNADPMILSRLMLVSMSGALVAGVLFTRSFLMSRQVIPNGDRVLVGVMVAAGMLAALCPFMDFRVLDRCYTYLGISGTIAIIGSGVMCLRRGFRPARYLVLAWSVYAATACVYGLTISGAIPYTLTGYYGFQMGSGLEAILLAFAVGDRIRTLRREREDAREGERRYMEQSITDSLTGLNNADHFRSQIRTAVERADATESPLTLVLLDIDDFKGLNDTYGHPEGDCVLACIGRIIRSCVREGDPAYRSGGEEFALILEGNGLSSAADVAERIRVSLESRPFAPRLGGRYRVTVSIGIAEHKQGEESFDLVYRADQALYAAKARGKNRIAIDGQLPTCDPMIAS